MAETAARPANQIGDAVYGAVDHQNVDEFPEKLPGCLDYGTNDRRIIDFIDVVLVHHDAVHRMSLRSQTSGQFGLRIVKEVCNKRPCQGCTGGDSHQDQFNTARSSRFTLRFRASGCQKRFNPVGAMEYMRNACSPRDHRKYGEHNQCYQHGCRRLMDVMHLMMGIPRRSEKREYQQPEHIKRRETRGNNSNCPEDLPVGPVAPLTPENGVFAEEAGKRWEAGDGYRADRKRSEGPRHVTSQPAHL